MPLGNIQIRPHHAEVALEDPQRVLCESCCKKTRNSGIGAIDRGHWHTVDAVLSRTQCEPDALQRIQNECMNYATLAALLIGA